MAVFLSFGYDSGMSNRFVLYLFMFAHRVCPHFDMNCNVCVTLSCFLFIDSCVLTVAYFLTMRSLVPLTVLCDGGNACDAM